MFKTLSILFLTASMAQAQTSLLCEDDFTSSSVAGCNITSYSQNFQRTGDVLQYNSFYPGPNQDFMQNLSVTFSNSLSDYDTLKLEMDLKINNPNSYLDVLNNWIIFNDNNFGILFNYTDTINNKSYSGFMKNDPSRINIGGRVIGTYNANTTNRFVAKFSKPMATEFSIMNLENLPVRGNHFFYASWGILNPIIYGKYNFNINEDPSFVSKIKEAFCATTGNPTDCGTKVNVYAPPINPIYFEIDNFKAYGIKIVPTGIEEEIKLLNTRTLIGMYNSLGQKLDADQTHEGLVIKMYSDGIKEKVVIK